MNSCGLGAAGGGDHLGLGGVGAAVEDVVAHRAVQQRGVLRHHADVRAQAVLRDLGDVLAVDQQPARLDVVEAQQQVDERRLARARAADQADLLARLDVLVLCPGEQLHGQDVGVAVDDAAGQQRARLRHLPKRSRMRGTK
jgi:hypothetical protein